MRNERRASQQAGAGSLVLVAEPLAIAAEGLLSFAALFSAFYNDSEHW